MNATDEKKKDLPAEQPTYGADEMNLIDYPFATVHHRDSRKAIIVEQWKTDKKGRREKITWTVSSDVLVGKLPGSLGVDVWLALLTLAREEGWPEIVRFTVYRVLKILGLPDTKYYYDAVRREIELLYGTSIRCRKAFWDSNDREYKSYEGFSLIEDYRVMYCVNDERYSEHEGATYVKLGKRILDSARAGHIKQIDMTFRRSLSRPVSKALHRFLDKQMWYRERFEIDIFTLASLLGLPPYKYPSKVIEKLQPGIDDLIEKEFLKDAQVKKVGKYTRLVFTRTTTGTTTADTVVEAEEPALTAVNEESEVTVNDPQEAAPDAWDKLKKQHGVSEDHEGLWSKVLQELQYRISAAPFQSFIKQTMLLTIDGESAMVGVGNAYAKDFLSLKLSKKLLDGLNEQLEQDAQEPVSAIEFIVMEEQEAEA